MSIGAPHGLSLEPAAWVANNERITNEVDREAWRALYAPDAVLETITDGLHERQEGIAAIESAIDTYGAVFRARRLKVSKRLVSATGDVVVNTWTGGFDGRTRQCGIEFFRLRDGLVVHHAMYTFLDVRPATSLLARLRLLLAAPRPMLALGRAQRRG
jgi:hypothetical protein